MAIWMDKHEKGDMRALVESECSEVRMSDGFGGDYAAGGFLIERKRWAELPGRMMDPDTDLYYQLGKLAEAAETMDLEPALLLEGEIGESFRHTSVSASQVSKYLDGATMLGVHTMASTGQEATARKLARLEDGEPPDVRRVRGSPDGGETEAPRFVVEGVPDVGPSTAESLLEELGTPADVAVASEEELSEADGVGPATAEKVRRAFNSEYEG